MKTILPSDKEVMPDLKEEDEAKEEVKQQMPVALPEVKEEVPQDAGQPAEEGVIKWVFDPDNIFQQFELYLRGYYFDRITGKIVKIYETYIDPETGEEVQVPYKVANEQGINDIMSTLIFNVNKVFSFSIKQEEEIKTELAKMAFDLHERYIVKYQKQFEIRPADGYKIGNDMYNIILSAWSQSLGGKGMGLIGTTVNVNENGLGSGNQSNSKPFWRIPLIRRR